MALIPRGFGHRNSNRAVDAKAQKRENATENLPWRFHIHEAARTAASLSHRAAY
jgi:hypothetical protein